MRVIQRQDLLELKYRIPATNITTKEVEYIKIDTPTNVLFADENGHVKVVFNNVVYDIDSIDLDYLN